MTDSEIFDSDKAIEAIGSMWLRLARQISDAIPDQFIGTGDAVRVIKLATCAEACFWKATGEADAHDIKDVLKTDNQAQTPEL